MAKGKKIEEIEKQYLKADKYVQPLSKDNLTPEIFDALEVDDATLPINKIIPDPTQPRRIFPEEFHEALLDDGIEFAIEVWEEYVLDGTDDFPTVEILEGKKSVADYVNQDAIVMAFAEMVSFAANIRDVGLNHPIGVVTRGDVYRIIYGERRWTAFQFLNHYLGGYDKIPAKVSNVSEWELAKMQASENSQRPELNAIAKARMFAKLLMIARTDGGERYDSWNQLVNPGGCDRAWYAQVWNGEIHRIPRGMGPQFEQALNISEITMRKYRSLLKLFDNHNLSHKVNDALWMLGDSGDWSENFLREIGQHLTIDDVDEILNETEGYTVPTGTVSQTEDALREAVASAKKAAELAKKQAEREAPHPPTPSPTGEGEQATVEPPVQESKTNDYPNQLAGDEDSDNADTPNAANTGFMDKYGLPLMVGQTVKTRTGHIGKVTGTHGRLVTVEIGDNQYASGGHFPNSLEIVKPETSPPNPLSAGSDGEQFTGSWKDMIVQTVVGAVAIVVEDNGDSVKIQFAAGRYTNQRKADLSFVEYSEWVAAVNRHQASLLNKTATGTTPPGKPAPEKSVYPGEKMTTAQMVGKPGMYNGQPVIVIGTLGSERVLVQIGKDRIEVDADLIDFTPVVDETKPLKEILSEVQETSSDAIVQIQPYLLAPDEDENVRQTLGYFQKWASQMGNEDGAAAIEGLLTLRRGQLSSGSLGELLDEICDSVERAWEIVRTDLFEHFDLLMEEAENGES